MTAGLDDLPNLLADLAPAQLDQIIDDLPPAAVQALLDQLDTATAGDEADMWICSRPECDGTPHDRWTEPHARTSQREPDTYEVWAIVTGRGWGKTRCGAETVKRWGNNTSNQHIAVIGKTDRETRNICFEGPAGLLNVIPHDQVGRYSRSGGDTVLTLKNGTIFRGFSAERPETLRGYAFTGSWCDEFASWASRSAEDCWDNLWFALREAEQPRVIVTTTPRNLPHMKAILESADHITRGHTAENRVNLSDAALRTLEARYHGTRIGRQELAGELLEDVEGALWTPDDLERSRVDASPDLIKTVVGVDPPSGPGTCGIIVVGLGKDHHLYVLADYSMTDVQPSQWADAVATAAKDHGALVIAEINQGGRMVREVLQQANRMLPVTTVNAAQGKQARAEPIALLWEAEAQTAHMAGRDMIDLEAQMIGWVPGTFSPDRVDACLVAGTPVLTRFGEIPIEGIEPGDEVWTRHGWRPVEAGRLTHRQVPVIRVELSSSRSLTGTPDHRVWVEDKGWTRLDALVWGDKLSGWSRSVTTASPTPETRTAPAKKNAAITPPHEAPDYLPFTAKSTSITTVKSLTAGTSTTSTATRTTTNQETWSRSHLPGTPRSMDEPTWGLQSSSLGCNRSDHLLPTGTVPLKGSLGIPNTVAGHGKGAGQPKSSVSSVVNRPTATCSEIERGSVLAGVPAEPLIGNTDTNAESTVQSAAPNSGSRSTGRNPEPVAVTVLGSSDAGIADVYDIQVADVHEFTASGVIVHNCVWASTYLLGSAGFRGHVSVPGRLQRGPITRSLGGNSTRAGYRGLARR